jgi:hypothetical protein
VGIENATNKLKEDVKLLRDIEKRTREIAAKVVVAGEGPEATEGAKEE